MMARSTLTLGDPPPRQPTIDPPKPSKAPKPAPARPTGEKFTQVREGDRVQFNKRVTQAVKGEIDIPGDGVPPAKFVEVMNDPTWKDLTIVTEQLHTGYVTMNVNVKPFDNVLVRQAVNMAINKDRVVQIINNRAVPANQPLPPAMPGS